MSDWMTDKRKSLLALGVSWSRELLRAPISLPTFLQIASTCSVHESLLITGVITPRSAGVLYKISLFTPQGYLLEENRLFV